MSEGREARAVGGGEALNVPAAEGGDGLLHAFGALASRRWRPLGDGVVIHFSDGRS